MNELALFTGAGGGVLGSQLLGWRVLCGVEIDPYCREVLLRRQEEGFIRPFPLWDDVRTFDGNPWRGKVDIVTGGFPCQPWSQAGKRLGASDERNLWPDTFRIITEVAPAAVLLENVPGLRCPRGNKGFKSTAEASYFGQVVGDLAQGGYCVRWDCIPASAVGAPHRRDRLWIVANRDRDGRGRILRQARCGTDKSELRKDVDRESIGDERSGPARALMANDDCSRQPDIQGSAPDAATPRRRALGATGWWDVEPDVGRVAHGVAYRVDRLKALGNGQVPAVVRAAWFCLKGGSEH